MLREYLALAQETCAVKIFSEFPTYQQNLSQIVLLQSEKTALL